MSKKIQVQFSERQIELLRRCRGELGDTDADVVRSIVTAWLAEKNIISAVVQDRISKQNEPPRKPSAKK